jgi:hypothetical protein
MEVNGQLQAPAALAQKKGPPVTFGEEAGWAPEPIWTICRSENSLRYQDSNLNPSFVQPLARK